MYFIVSSVGFVCCLSLFIVSLVCEFSKCCCLVHNSKFRWLLKILTWSSLEQFFFVSWVNLLPQLVAFLDLTLLHLPPAQHWRLTFDIGLLGNFWLTALWLHTCFQHVWGATQILDDLSFPHTAMTKLMGYPQFQKMLLCVQTRPAVTKACLDEFPEFRSLLVLGATAGRRHL